MSGGLSSAMHISIGGMQAQMTRMGVVATNVANMQTTRTVEGGPYRRKDVAFSDVDAGGVRAEIVEDPNPTRQQFDPKHPDAGKDGFVEMPNVDPASEMVDLMSASNDFMVNLLAVQKSQEAYEAVLDILA